MRGWRDMVWWAGLVWVFGGLVAGAQATSATPASPASTARADGSPPAGVSLVTEYAPLDRLASGGDAQAAKQLAADFMRCEDVVASHAAITGWQQVNPGKPLPAELLGRAAETDDAAVLCAGYQAQFQDGRVYQVLWQAATLGDSHAAACYVAGSYFTRLGRFPASTPSTYQGYATTLLQRAIREGQWRVVQAALESMSFRVVDEAPLAAFLGGDVATRYRLNRLLRLGAEPDSKEIRMLDRDTDFLAKLTPRQRAEGEAWAKDMFARYFRASGPSTPFTQVCTGRPGGYS
ncbi:hypothetical protein [Dyella sp. ASV21]|uniref:hypothetical protein n=1 Tax=Dyella sp. ASV21 TaxID=2795114 RepID=UPI0018ED21C4|nr:hypothetical protein [Dyella sp. ASV21]